MKLPGFHNRNIWWLINYSEESTCKALRHPAENNNRCQDKVRVEMLIGLEWRSVYANMRYTLFCVWLAYSLFLAFPVTCEQSIIGKACYLSSWWMRYGMMKETLLLLQSTWEIFLQKFKINSLSPQWCWISDQSHILVSLKTFHISCLLCVEFCQVLLTLLRDLSCF